MLHPRSNYLNVLLVLMLKITMFLLAAEIVQNVKPNQNALI